MPSLRSLVAAHRSVLLIDSSSACIQVGLWQCSTVKETPGGPEHDESDLPLPRAIWHASEQEAGIAIFAGVDSVLAQARIGVADLGALVFCEGPGSILGIRTAATALRIWTATDAGGPRVFSYRSLELVARDLRRRETPEPFAVVADARRDSWHWVAANAGGAIGPLQRIPASDAGRFGGGFFTPSGFRSWSKFPGDVSTVHYDLADLWPHQGDADILRAAPNPDAFLHEEITYLAWTPKIHRAGINSPRIRTES
jgi:tRNA threonylcarbamoyladenosine biosynthesis protein TsaB